MWLLLPIAIACAGGQQAPVAPDGLPFRIDLPAEGLTGQEAVFLCGQRAAVEAYLKDDRLARAAFAPIDAFNSLRIEIAPRLVLKKVSCSPSGIEKEYSAEGGLSARSTWRADAERPFFRIDYEIENGSRSEAGFLFSAEVVSNVGFINKFIAHPDDLAILAGKEVLFSDRRFPELEVHLAMDPEADGVRLKPDAGTVPDSQPAALERRIRIAPGARAKVSILVKGSDRAEEIASISSRAEPRPFLPVLEGAIRLETPSPVLNEFAAACTAWPAANVRQLPFGPPHDLDGRKNRSWPVITASPDYHGIFANDCVQTLKEIGLLGRGMDEFSRNTVETMFRYGPKESVEWWTGDGKVWMFPAPLGDTPQIALGASWHLLWSGDRDLARRWWPDILRCLAVLDANDSDGDSLEDRPNTPYPEQPDPGEFNHEMLYVECFWRQAFGKAADVAEWMGLAGADRFREKSARIGRSIEEKFGTPYGLAVWLNRRHEAHPHIGHEQIIAAAEGDVSDAKALQIVETVTRPPIWTPDGPLRAEPGKGVAAGGHVWSFMRWKLVLAMFRLDQTDRALETAERWAVEERGLLYQAPEGFPAITGTTGKGYTWTAGRALRAIVFGLTGLSLDGKGVEFRPRLPSRWKEFALRGLTVHGTRIDLEVRRGPGAVLVNGKTRDRAALSYEELRGGPVRIEVSAP